MRLNVIYKGNQLAGQLWRDDSGYHFEYNDTFITNENAFPISVNMPKSQKNYSSKVLFPVFQTMLSEGYNRDLQCKSLGIDPSDDWGLLMYTCEVDTIGAITVKKQESDAIL
jgi:HipA-like protein